MSKYRQRSDPTSEQPVHPQIEFILDRLAELSVLVEEDIFHDDGTLSAAWQGFMLAADFWEHEPEMMHRLYEREGWGTQSADLSRVRALLRQLEG